jgi:hypothetical protein
MGIRHLLVDKLNNSIPKSRTSSNRIATRRTKAITPLWLQPEEIKGYKVSRGQHGDSLLLRDAWNSTLLRNTPPTISGP